MPINPFAPASAQLEGRVKTHALWEHAPSRDFGGGSFFVALRQPHEAWRTPAPVIIYALLNYHSPSQDHLQPLGSVVGPIIKSVVDFFISTHATCARVTATPWNSRGKGVSGCHISRSCLHHISCRKLSFYPILQLVYSSESARRLSEVVFTLKWQMTKQIIHTYYLCTRWNTCFYCENSCESPNALRIDSRHSKCNIILYTRMIE